MEPSSPTEPSPHTEPRARAPRWIRLIDERVVLWIIALNLLVVFIHAFPRLPPALDVGLAAADYACLVYFCVEIALKVRLLGWPAFWARALNRFDLLIVVLSLPALVTAFTNFSDLHVLLVLRGARLLRLLRVLRFVPHAEQLWAGITRALRASVGLLLGLALYNVVLALIANRLFADISPAHFGDPLLSLYSMFKVFTVEGWNTVPDVLASTTSVGALARGFFVFAVLTGGILGLGIVNAVFVDEMVMDNNDALEARVVDLQSELAALRAQQDEVLRLLRERP